MTCLVAYARKVGYLIIPPSRLLSLENGAYVLLPTTQSSFYRHLLIRSVPHTSPSCGRNNIACDPCDRNGSIKHGTLQLLHSPPQPTRPVFFSRLTFNPRPHTPLSLIHLPTNMKTSTFLTLLFSALSAATPLATPLEYSLLARQDCFDCSTRLASCKNVGAPFLMRYC